MCLSAMEMTSFSENVRGLCDYDTVQCYHSPTEMQNLCFFGRQPYSKIVPTLILMHILCVHNVWKSVLNIAKPCW